MVVLTKAYSLLLGNMYFGFGLAVLIPQQMGLHNPYVNGVLIGISNIVAHIFMLFTFHLFTRKFYHYFHISGMVFLSIILMILSLKFDSNNFTANVLESVLSGIFKPFWIMRYKIYRIINNISLILIRI